jgi:hypothetical protein
MNQQDFAGLEVRAPAQRAMRRPVGDDEAGRRDEIHGAGIGKMSASRAITCSAKPPRSSAAATRSPGFTRVTPAPQPRTTRDLQAGVKGSGGFS